MLHPVGDLPASVYWRRRLLVLVVLVAVLAGAVGLVLLLAGRAGGDTPTEDTASSSRPARTAALDRVAPSLAGVRTPDQAPATDVGPAASARTAAGATAAGSGAPTR